MKPTPQTYTELQTAYDHFNRELFGGSLPPCLLTLQREKLTLGYFCRSRFVSTANPAEMIDEIALNPTYFSLNAPDALPWQRTMQTIVHEMCHLWQFHFGDPGRARYHNREWGAKMKEVGLYPSNTGAPGGKETGDQMTDYAIPGGRFLAAYKELQQGNYALSWKDRLAEFQGVDQKGKPIRKPTQAGGESVSRPQTRVKFTCPECGVNAWGKPSLRLVCGDCNVALESTE